MNRSLIGRVRRYALAVPLLLAAAAPQAAWGQAKLPTREQAVALSEATGRPIFAVAGQET